MVNKCDNYVILSVFSQAKRSKMRIRAVFFMDGGPGMCGPFIGLHGVLV